MLDAGCWILARRASIQHLTSSIYFQGGSMYLRGLFVCLLCLLAAIVGLSFLRGEAALAEKHYLYVASPGIRNYVEYGGVGILVFDVDQGHKWVKRIPTWEVPAGQPAENIKGIEASAKTAKIYVSTPRRVACFDLISERKVW